MKPRLYFVHGAGGSRHVWHYQTAFFGADAEAVDLPGHPDGEGRSTVEDYVSWLHDRLRARAEQPVVLVGHSMGGAIAQLHALLHPQDLRGLVLVSTGARLRVSPRLLEALDQDYERAIEMMVGWSFSPGVDPRVRERSAAMLREVPVAVARGDFEACDRFDLLDRLGEIAVPTLILCGTADLMTPTKYSQFLADRIPGARLRYIEGAGHMVMLEKPGELNLAIDGFVRSL